MAAKSNGKDKDNMPAFLKGNKEIVKGKNKPEMKEPKKMIEKKPNPKKK